MNTAPNDGKLDKNVFVDRELASDVDETSNQFSTTHETEVVVNDTVYQEKKRPILFKTDERKWFKVDTKVKVVMAFSAFTCATILIAILLVTFNTIKLIPKCQSKLISTSSKSTVTDSHPQSIAIADFNNDTWFDIAIANSGADNIGVLLGYDNGTFQSQRIYSTGIGSIPYAVSVGDLDNDYRMDLIVANFGTHEVWILHGNGNGTFAHQASLSTGSSRPTYVAVSDLNNDALLDIVIATDGNNAIDIILAIGYGKFRSSVTLSTGYDSLPYSVAVGNLNSDMHMDIVVTNRGTNSIGIFFGYGDGRFSHQFILNTGAQSYPCAVLAADFDNDTHTDIAVANCGSHNIHLFFGSGDGNFPTKVSYSTGNQSKPISIQAADFNNDNLLDILAADGVDDNVGILFGNGKRTFQSLTLFPIESHSHPYFVLNGDFNSDHRTDIAVVHRDNNRMGVLLGYGQPTFLDQKAEYIESPISVAVGYFNNDNRLDLAVIGKYKKQIVILLGNDDQTLSRGSTIDSNDRLKSYSLLVAADFNNDNRSDLAVIDDAKSMVYILLGNDDGTLTSQSSITIGRAVLSSLATGNFNNDSKIDIAVLNRRFNTVHILFGKGDGTFLAQPAIYINGMDTVSLAVGDFNNDNLDDFIVSSLSSYSISVSLGDGNGAFQNLPIYETGYWSGPVSVATGDFNNDSRLDAVVVNVEGGNVVVFLGDGQGTFYSQAYYSLIESSRPVFVTVGDFNNDKRLDVFVVMSAANKIALLPGYGDGTFANAIDYPTGPNSKPLTLALGDLNGDGRLDIVVTNNGTNSVGIWLGFLQASFTKEMTQSTGSSSRPHCAAVGDLDNDTHIDIVLANYGADSVDIQYGDGDGHFSKQTTHSINFFASPTSVAVGHFNSDRRIDIVTANSAADNVGVFYQDENGRFEEYTMYTTGSNSQPQSVSSGDFNHDGRADLIVASYGTGSINVLLRSHAVHFASEVTYSTGSVSRPHGHALGDWNNDSRLDLVVTNNYRQSLGIFLGNGDGTFSNQSEFSTNYPYPVSVAAGDFDNDGRLDIVVAENIPGMIELFLGNGDGTFEAHGSYHTGPNSWPSALTAHDFDDDKQLDIVVTYYQFGGTSRVVIFLGSGDGMFQQRYEYPTGYLAGAAWVSVADLNNDKKLDVVVVNTLAGNIGVLFGNGDGTFSDQIIYPTGNQSRPTSVAIGDLNNDSRVDLVISLSADNTVAILFGYDNGSFFHQSTYFMGNNAQPTAVALADLNHDGQLDILVANAITANVAILLGFINGTFFNQTTFSTGDFSEPSFLSTADLNNDNQLDIIVSNEGTDSIGVFVGHTEDTFLSTPLYSTNSSSGLTYVTVQDLNNDTRLDLIVTNNQTNNIIIGHGTGYGTFHNPITYSTGSGSHPCWIAIGDLDGDRHSDIVVANRGNDRIGIFFSKADGSFSSQITYSTGAASQPSSVAIGDFNNDARMDIAVARYEANSVALFLGYGNGTFASPITFTSGFESHPIALTTGDVNGDNQTDLVVTNSGYGNIDILSEVCRLVKP